MKLSQIKTLFIFITVVAIYLSSGCNTSKKYSFTIDSLQVYGDDSKNLMAWIADFQYKNDKVYIWDSVQLIMFIYSVDGDFIKHIKFQEGKGPGELTKNVHSFGFVSDTTFVFLDIMDKRVQFISTNGKYIKGFSTNFTPWQFFVKDSLLYIASVEYKSLIRIYDFNGRTVEQILKPFKSDDKSLVLPFVSIDDDLSIYSANTLKTEISKWVDNKLLWTFRDKKSEVITSLGTTGAWLSIFTLDNFLLASANPGNTDMSDIIFIIDKNNGKLLSTKRLVKPFFAKSFENSKYIFVRENEPFPHLNKIKLRIEED